MVIDTIVSWPTKRCRYGGTMISHPFHKLLFIAAAVGIALAFRSAVADKGGTYDPADQA